MVKYKISDIKVVYLYSTVKNLRLECLAVSLEYFVVTLEYLAYITSVVSVPSGTFSHDPYVDSLSLHVT